MAQPGPAEDRRQRIVDAAVAVFARDGRHAARIQDIADAAGVAYGLVYHYFGTKDRLLEVVYDENWAAFADAVEGIASAPRSLDDRLRAVVDYVLGALETYPDRVRVIILEYGRSVAGGAGLDHPQVARALAGVRRLAEEAAAAGRLDAGVDPGVLVLLWMGALEAAVASTARPASERPDAAALRRTVHAVIRSVLRPDPVTP